MDTTWKQGFNLINIKFDYYLATISNNNFGIQFIFEFSSIFSGLDCSPIPSNIGSQYKIWDGGQLLLSSSFEAKNITFLNRKQKPNIIQQKQTTELKNWKSEYKIFIKINFHHKTTPFYQCHWKPKLNYFIFYPKVSNYLWFYLELSLRRIKRIWDEFKMF